MKKDDKYEELFELDPASKTWKKVELPGEGPPQIFRHSSVLVGEKVFVFGGKTWNGKSDEDNSDLFILDYTV